MSVQAKKTGNSMRILVLVLLIITTVITIESGESCTIFTASYDDTVLFGNNEDFYNYSMWVYIEQPSEAFQYYGGFYLGHTYSSGTQGGMNEKGLCYDGNARPNQEMNYDYNKTSYNGRLIDLFMRRCANVSEVINLAKEYNWGLSMPYQLLFADATGDAVVIHPGSDGEINFTRKVKDDGFLVSTNFNRGYPESGQFPCWRYDTAVSMLSDELKSEEDLSIDLFRSILDDTHPEGPSVNTIYSNIFDPVNKMAYLYYWHQFEEVAEFNITEEIAKRTEDEYISLNDIFSLDIQEKADAEYESYLLETDRQRTFEDFTELIALVVYSILILGFGILVKKKFFSK